MGEFQGMIRNQKMMSRDDSDPEKSRIIATIEATEPTLKPNPNSKNSKNVNFDSKVHTKTFYSISSESDDDETDDILADEIHNLSIQDKEDSILAPDSEAESFLVSESDSCSSPIISRSMPLDEELPLRRTEKKISNSERSKNDFELWKRDIMFDIYSIKRFLTNLEKKIQNSNKWE